MGAASNPGCCANDMPYTVVNRAALRLQSVPSVMYTTRPVKGQQLTRVSTDAQSSWMIGNHHLSKTTTVDFALWPSALHMRSPATAAAAAAAAAHLMSGAA